MCELPFPDHLVVLKIVPTDDDTLFSPASQLMRAMTARNEPMWRQMLQQRVAIQPTQPAPVFGTLEERDLRL